MNCTSTERQDNAAPLEPERVVFELLGDAEQRPVPAQQDDILRL